MCKKKKAIPIITGISTKQQNKKIFLLLVTVEVKLVVLMYWPPLFL